MVKRESKMECHGVLWEIRDGELVRYRCRVGHAYGSETLMAEQDGSVEGALWTAFQSLKERAALARRMCRRLARGWPPRAEDPLGVPVAVRTRRSEVIPRVLKNGDDAGPRMEHERTGRAAIV